MSEFTLEMNELDAKVHLSASLDRVINFAESQGIPKKNVQEMLADLEKEERLRNSGKPKEAEDFAWKISEKHRKRFMKDTDYGDVLLFYGLLGNNWGEIRKFIPDQNVADGIRNEVRERLKNYKPPKKQK